MATRATATGLVSMWAMAAATRLAGDEEGKGKCGKGNDNDDEGGG